MLHSGTDGQCHTDPALSPGIFRTIGLGAMLPVDRTAGSLLRGTVDERVVKDQVPDWLREKRHNQSGQLHPKCNP